MLSQNKTKILSLIAVLLLAIPSIIPLLTPGFFVTDDGNWMIVRFSAFYQAMSDGQFPVRWLTRLNQSYGYPVANFLYPGFMYLGVPLKLAGLSFLDTVKALMAISMVGSSLFCFLWLRKSFSSLASIAGSLLYLYFPYHIYDLYVRGSLGEVFALCLVPFVLWQIDRKSFIFSTLGIFLLILSHNTLALLFLPVIAIYVFLKEDFRKMYLWYSSVFVLGLFLAAFFWMPAIIDLSSTVFLKTEVSEWSGYFSDISLVGFSIPVIFVTTLFIFSRKGNVLSKDKTTVFFFVLGLLALFFSTRLSSFLWEILPMSFVQFPFRSLSVLILSGAFLGAYSIENMKTKNLRIIVTVVFLVVLYPSLLKVFSVENTSLNNDVLATNEDTTTVKNEYLPIWAMEVPLERPESFLLIDGKPSDVITRPTTNMVFEVNTDKATTVRFNHLYFPGWMVFVNGQEEQINYKDGLISFDLDSGVSSVNIVFRETSSRLFADAVSVLALVLIIVVGWLFKIKKYGKDTKMF